MLTLKPDSATLANMVSEMKKLLLEAEGDEEFLVFARGIIADSPFSGNDQLKTVLEYVRNNVAYQPDPAGTELFTSPHRMMELINQGAAFGDCVTGDTPVWIKNQDIPSLIEIQELLPFQAVYAQYGGLEILGPQGFVPLISVRRKPARETVRLCSTSDFSCTPDHKVIIEEGRHGFGRYARALDTDADKLLRKYPPESSIPRREGNRELAWAYGLFFADGSISLGSRGGGWRLVNHNTDDLERARATFDSAFPAVRFDISAFPSYAMGVRTNLGTRTKNLYCLDAKLRHKSDRGLITTFARNFAREIYTSTKAKKVPQSILFGTSEVAKAFLDGAFHGNGAPSDYCRRISVNKKISSLGLAYLFHSIGEEPFVARDHDAVRVHGGTSKHHPWGKWREAGHVPVYDVATATGEFVAGDIAVKNCDDVAIFCTAICRSLGYDACVILLDQQGQGYNHAATQVYSETTHLTYYMDPTLDTNSMGMMDKIPGQLFTPGYIKKLEVR